MSIAIGLLTSLCIGCGRPAANYSSLELVNATGTVTLDGQPLSEAVVTFDAPDGQFSYGLTDSSGGYSLQIDSQKRGVTPGEKTVRISTTRKILGLNATEGESDPASPGASAGEKVPAQYHKDSELKVSVSSDKTRYDFDLKSN
ncbi:MAG: carboxypeptidase-like regulatory domain-containing protein [Planctomycetaceae bacterium]|nr:carboxypeptidase-like regulatory domain-containing protein [Planctomycetaceae bacterium]